MLGAALNGTVRLSGKAEVGGTDAEERDDSAAGDEEAKNGYAAPVEDT